MFATILEQLIGYVGSVLLWLIACKVVAKWINNGGLDAATAQLRQWFDLKQ